MGKIDRCMPELRQEMRIPPQDEPPLLGLFRIGSSVLVLNRKSESRFGLSIAQWALLREVERNPALSALALAASLGLTPGTLTPSLARLSRKGYLLVAADPRDSRKKVVVITRKGRRRMHEASGPIGHWSRELAPLAEGIRQVRDGIQEVALEL